MMDQNVPPQDKIEDTQSANPGTLAELQPPHWLFRSGFIHGIISKGSLQGSDPHRGLPYRFHTGRCLFALRQNR